MARMSACRCYHARQPRCAFYSLSARTTVFACVYISCGLRLIAALLPTQTRQAQDIHTRHTQKSVRPFGWVGYKLRESSCHHAAAATRGNRSVSWYLVHVLYSFAVRGAVFACASVRGNTACHFPENNKRRAYTAHTKGRAGRWDTGWMALTSACRCCHARQRYCCRLLRKTAWRELLCSRALSLKTLRLVATSLIPTRTRQAQDIPPWHTKNSGWGGGIETGEGSCRHGERCVCSGARQQQ